MSIEAGASSRKRIAAALAASIRVGSTSSAPIDSEVSMVNTTTARSGKSRSTGPANPTISSAAVPRNRTATTWRRHPGRAGATASMSEVSENRSAYRPRRPWRIRYTTASRPTARRNHSRFGSAKRRSRMRLMPGR